MCEDFKSETRTTASQRLCQTCLQQGDSQSVPRLALTLDRAINSMIAALFQASPLKGPRLSITPRRPCLQHRDLGEQTEIVSKPHVQSLRGVHKNHCSFLFLHPSVLAHRVLTPSLLIVPSGIILQRGNGENIPFMKKPKASSNPNKHLSPQTVLNMTGNLYLFAMKAKHTLRSRHKTREKPIWGRVSVKQLCRTQDFKQNFHGLGLGENPCRSHEETKASCLQKAGNNTGVLSTS